MIRHAGAGVDLPATILALTVAMIEPSFRALLVPFVGSPPLLTAGHPATFGAAIAVPAITMRTDEEGGVTASTETRSLQENRFAMNRRHALSQAELDNGVRFVAG